MVTRCILSRLGPGHMGFGPVSWEFPKASRGPLSALIANTVCIPREKGMDALVLDDPALAATEKMKELRQLMLQTLDKQVSETQPKSCLASRTHDVVLMSSH